jgi:hypothetical protein
LKAPPARPESAVAEMEQFIARAQAALDELRKKIAGS